MRPIAHALNVGLTITRIAREHDIKYPAAALAYYGFVSQIPLLILVLAVFSDQLVSRLRTVTPTFLSPEAQQLLAEALRAGSGRTGAVVLAGSVLVWSGANVVVGFQTVVNRVEHTTGESLRIKLHDGGSILGSFGLLVLSIILTNVVFGFLPNGRLLAYSEPLVLFGMLTIAFFPLYYAPSRVVTRVVEALPGALTAALGWTVLLTAIRFYGVTASEYALYGVLGGIIIILTSFYLGAIILMLGVIVNTVAADLRNPSRP
jgi:membrane protein